MLVAPFVLPVRAAIVLFLAWPTSLSPPLILRFIISNFGFLFARLSKGFAENLLLSEVDEAMFFRVPVKTLEGGWDLRESGLENLVDLPPVEDLENDGVPIFLYCLGRGGRGKGFLLNDC